MQCLFGMFWVYVIEKSVQKCYWNFSFALPGFKDFVNKFVLIWLLVHKKALLSSDLKPLQKLLAFLVWNLLLF